METVAPFAKSDDGCFLIRAFVSSSGVIRGRSSTRPECVAVFLAHLPARRSDPSSTRSGGLCISSVLFTTQPTSGTLGPLWLQCSVRPIHDPAPGSGVSSRSTRDLPQRVKAVGSESWIGLGRFVVLDLLRQRQLDVDGVGILHERSSAPRRVTQGEVMADRMRMNH